MPSLPDLCPLLSLHPRVTQDGLLIREVGSKATVLFLTSQTSQPGLKAGPLTSHREAGTSRSHLVQGFSPFFHLQRLLQKF